MFKTTGCQPMLLRVMLQYCYINLLVQRFRWELKLSYRDGINCVECDPRHVLALQADEVVFTDQKGPVCDEHKSLLLIVPVVNSGKVTRRSLRGLLGCCHVAWCCHIY